MCFFIIEAVKCNDVRAGVIFSCQGRGQSLRSHLDSLAKNQESAWQPNHVNCFILFFFCIPSYRSLPAQQAQCKDGNDHSCHFQWWTVTFLSLNTIWKMLPDWATCRRWWNGRVGTTDSQEHHVPDQGTWNPISHINPWQDYASHINTTWLARLNLIYCSVHCAGQDPKFHPLGIKKDWQVKTTKVSH